MRTPQPGGCFECAVVDDRPGFVTLFVSGAGAIKLFENEPGGHRWQRVPPTERKGRVHTSTVTVAVLNPDLPVGQALDPRDVEITTTGASGPGGQNVNKVETCVIARHRVTGISVRISTERSQYQNKQHALQLLQHRVHEFEREKVVAQQKVVRNSQIGSGMRGDKIRTYRVKDDTVTDSVLGRTSLTKWMRGIWVWKS